MGKKERTEEKELINQIKEFKNLFRLSLKEKAFKEREERHKKGEIFFKGLWIPKSKVTLVQKKLRRRELTAFLEALFLLLIILGFNVLLVAFFKNFILP